MAWRIFTVRHTAQSRGLLLEASRREGLWTLLVLNNCFQMTVDYSLPVSSIHGILWARILEWVAMPSSRGSSRPRDQTQVSLIAGGFCTVWATKQSKNTGVGSLSLLEGIFWTQESNQGLLHCRWTLYQLNYQGSPLQCTHISKHHVVAFKHTRFLYVKDICKCCFPGGSVGKSSACSAGDPGSVPGSGRSPGEENGNPLQYSCLENSMDRGGWWATIHGVAKNWTQVSD